MRRRRLTDYQRIVQLARARRAMGEAARRAAAMTAVEPTLVHPRRNR